MQSPDPLRPGERPFALALVIGAGLAFREAHAISGFSGLTTGGVMPMLAAAVMALSAVVILADTLRRPRAANSGFAGLVSYLFPLRVVLFALLVAAYGAAIPLAGFIPASGAFLFVAIWALWTRGPIIALVVSLASVAAIYGLFRVVFQVVLPSASLW